MPDPKGLPKIDLSKIPRSIGDIAIAKGTTLPAEKRKWVLTLSVSFLIVLLAFITFLLLRHFFTSITLAELKKLFPNVDKELLVENYIALRVNHLEELLSIFKAIVPSVIVPLITLFLGYIFGKGIE